MSTANNMPAFPVADVASAEPSTVAESRAMARGMSLRDYFAAKALCGIEASQGNSGHFVSTAEKVAERAYQLADAMLKVRSED